MTHSENSTRRKDFLPLLSSILFAYETSANCENNWVPRVNKGTPSNQKLKFVRKLLVMISLILSKQNKFSRLRPQFFLSLTLTLVDDDVFEWGEHRLYSSIGLRFNSLRLKLGIGVQSAQSDGKKATREPINWLSLIDCRHLKACWTTFSELISIFY